MRFTLQIVNLKGNEINEDIDFASMDALLAYVRGKGYEWTSLLIVVTQ